MKTFRWVQLSSLNMANHYVALLDDTQGIIVRTCGSLIPAEAGLFHVIVTNPDTKEKLTIRELLSLKDGKEAIEKKLFDDGVIEDGDLVVDTTEE